MSVKTEDGLDYFTEMVETQGVAVSTVADGHVLMFKREFLQSLLDKYADQEKLIIFIKRPDFKD